MGRERRQSEVRLHLAALSVDKKGVRPRSSSCLSLETVSSAIATFPERAGPQVYVLRLLPGPYLQQHIQQLSNSRKPASHLGKSTTHERTGQFKDFFHQTFFTCQS